MIANKTRPACPPLSLIKESGVLFLALRTFLVPNFPHQLEKNPDVSYYSSQTVHLLELWICKVGLTYTPFQLEIPFTYYHKFWAPKHQSWGKQAQCMFLHEEHKQGEKREVQKQGGKDFSLQLPQWPLLYSKRWQEVEKVVLRKSRVYTCPNLY